eukprot:m51a1_g8298 hypothetical protein (1424) ;mRNA; r:76-34062
MWGTTVTLSTGTGSQAVDRRSSAAASWVWLLRDSQTTSSSDPVGVGDVNGDRIDDFVLAVSWGSHLESSGIVILMGSATGLESPLDPFNTDMTTVLVQGVSLSCSCDLTGDGISDLVLQAPGRLVLLAGHTGEWPASVASRSLTTALWYGVASKARSVGDVNGDGIHDIAFLLNNCVTVVFGSTKQDFPAEHDVDGNNGFVLNASTAEGSMTDNFAGIGDVDGDKIDDIGVVIMAGAYINKGFDMDKDGRADVLLNVLYRYPSVRDTVQFGSDVSALLNQSYDQPLVCGGGYESGLWTVGDVDGDRAPDVAEQMNHNGGCQWTVYRAMYDRPGDKDSDHIVLGSQRSVNLASGQGIPVVTHSNLTSSGFSSTGVGDVDNDGVPDYAFLMANDTTGCWDIVVDAGFVAELYQRCPVPGYDLAKVEIIYSPHLEQAFENRVAQLQARISNKSFAPGYERESNRALRTAVRERLMTMVRKTPEAAFPNVKLVPMWHGTRTEALESVFRAGYANLATTDEGFFGKGVYSTYEARYASEVYSRGALLVNWVSFFSAYPVVDGDMEKLVGKGSYSNYDAHFIPVRPASGQPGEKNYVACSELSQAVFHELVVFEASQSDKDPEEHADKNKDSEKPDEPDKPGETEKPDETELPEEPEPASSQAVDRRSSAAASWVWLLRDSKTTNSSDPVGVGDVNGDRIDDFVLAVSWGSHLESSGIVILMGSAKGLENPLDPFNTDMTTVLVPGVTFSCSCDLNGDGISDLVLQAPGRLVLLAGHTGEWPTEVSWSLAVALWVGVVSNARSVGDVNGDGIHDIAFLRNNGVTVVFGSAKLDFRAQYGFDGTNGFVLNVTMAEGSTTKDFAGIGDVDGDKYDDIGVVVTAGAYINKGFDMDKDGRADVLLNVLYRYPSVRDTVQFGSDVSALLNQSYDQPLVCGGGYESGLWTVGDVDGDRAPDVAEQMNHNGGCQWTVYRAMYDRPGDKDSDHIVLGSQRSVNLASGQGIPVVTHSNLTSSGFSSTGVGDVDNDGVPDYAFLMANDTTGCWDIVVVTDSTPLGDHNGDKVDDVLVGVLVTWSTWDTTFTLSTSAVEQQRADRASWVWLLRDSDVSRSSSGPVGIGDINGDAIDDFVLNVSWGSSNNLLSGVTILLGTTAGLENPLDPFSTDLSTVLVRGVSFICSCDLDGDGLSDLVLQTPEWPASMDSRSLTTALWNGEVSKVRSVGDINGDRIQDIAFRTDNCITVVFGSSNRFFPAQHNIDGSNGFVVNISVAQGSATDDVVGVGDVDGDKYNDIGVVIKVGANINKMPYVVLVKVHRGRVYNVDSLYGLEMAGAILSAPFAPDYILVARDAPRMLGGSPQGFFETIQRRFSVKFVTDSEDPQCLALVHEIEAWLGAQALEAMAVLTWSAVIPGVNDAVETLGSQCSMPWICTE